MKKLLLFSLVGLVLSFGCAKEDKEKTTVLYFFTPYGNCPEYLNGKVKSVKEINYWAVEKNGKFMEGDTLSAKERDSLRWSYDFAAFYDELGLLTRIDYSGQNAKVNSWIVENDKKLLVKATWFVADTPKIYVKLIYDDRGYNKEYQCFSSKNDSLLNKYLIATNDKGQIVGVTAFDNRATCLSKSKVQWNDSSRVVGYYTYSSSDSLRSGFKTMYNHRGFYTSQELVNAKNEVSRVIMSKYLDYDKHGNWLWALIYDNGKPSFMVKRIYDYY